MKKIGIFYGTTSGITAGIVDEIEFYLRGENYEVFDVANGIGDIKEIKNLILVSPTYGVGELQRDWENVYDELKTVDFTNKVVGIVGVGNQFAFGESYVGAMRKLYDVVVKNGGKVVGFTSTEGYSYEETESIVDDKFVGLALDESNQDNETPDRIKAWIEEIKPLFV
ncbi:flavodoxin [Candidatus Cetobacterium colombiensis]|uniref:Flavodoxin n=1 Tax=Candidatus Cetobacterium colombiensis TaxID=3073100 RepID=A0ABU4WA26_9FUSO|nr:flavodoxin [Candidatus Cetobacterium colombiensis]MDX8336386.1 flavodoxin [Candidatus Cetobacterium colombiensis]